MMWNWQKEDWRDLRFDEEALRPSEAKFLTQAIYGVTPTALPVSVSIVQLAWLVMDPLTFFQDAKFVRFQLSFFNKAIFVRSIESLSSRKEAVAQCNNCSPPAPAPDSYILWPKMPQSRS